MCPGTPDLPLETLSSHSFYKFFVVFCFLLSRDFPKLLSFFCRPRDSGVLARETAGRSGGCYREPWAALVGDPGGGGVSHIALPAVIIDLFVAFQMVNIQPAFCI